MITVVNSGKFRLTETKHGTKVLLLNSRPYAWIVAPGIGSLLIYSDHPHNAADILSEGKFWLYQVEDEPHLADHLHLELQTGSKSWQGYLLLTGLPEKHDTRKRMIPTHEVITGASRYRIIKPHTADRASNHSGK